MVFLSYLLTRLLPAVGAQDPSHECVVAHMKCRNCNVDYIRTFEIMGEGDKIANNGRYHRIIRVKASHQIYEKWDFVEHVFHGMPSKYNFVFNNCKHWSRLFYMKIANACDRSMCP